MDGPQDRPGHAPERETIVYGNVRVDIFSWVWSEGIETQKRQNYKVSRRLIVNDPLVDSR